MKSVKARMLAGFILFFLLFVSAKAHMLISVGGGTAITSNLGQSQNFPIVNPNTDEFYNYQASNATQVRPIGDVFVGGEWALRSPWLLQLGVDFNQIQTFKATGTFVQGVDTASANQYSYNYSLLVRQWLIESKILYQYHDRFYPYFLWGLGVAGNKAYGYSTNVPSFATFTRQYSNNTQYSFSYAIGVGIDAAISEHSRLGIGYRLTNLGNVSLGSATINGAGVGGTLSQNHLYINEIIAQLTWIL